MTDNKRKVSYKKLSEELDDILQKLQDDDTDIDEALVLYERGNKLIKELNQYLGSINNKIVKIKPRDRS